MCQFMRLILFHFLICLSTIKEDYEIVKRGDMYSKTTSTRKNPRKKFHFDSSPPSLTRPSLTHTNSIIPFINFPETKYHRSFTQQSHPIKISSLQINGWWENMIYQCISTSNNPCCWKVLSSTAFNWSLTWRVI